MISGWKIVISSIIAAILFFGAISMCMIGLTNEVCQSRKMSYDIAATSYIKCLNDDKCNTTPNDLERIFILEQEITRVCGKVDKRQIP